MEFNEEIQALIELHRGLDRQGPGDESFSRKILSLLPPLPDHPRIADLGCGAGAGALLLAEWFSSPVTAVDFSGIFLKQLEERAAARGWGRLVSTLEADFGALDWPDASLDLLWSEGAAYTLTFPGALRAWRPLLAPGGVAVISEANWFTDRVPGEVRAFWSWAYPAMGTEAGNPGVARECGFKVLEMKRLPAEAWWRNYYDPLRGRIEAVRPSAGAVMRAVIRQTEVEMEMFHRYPGVCGYTFYVLEAAG